MKTCEWGDLGYAFVMTYASKKRVLICSSSLFYPSESVTMLTVPQQWSGHTFSFLHKKAWPPRVSSHFFVHLPFFVSYWTQTPTNGALAGTFCKYKYEGTLRFAERGDTHGDSRGDDPAGIAEHEGIDGRERIPALDDRKDLFVLARVAFWSLSALLVKR